jgi:hypothetical protein
MFRCIYIPMCDARHVDFRRVSKEESKTQISRKIFDFGFEIAEVRFDK